VFSIAQAPNCILSARITLCKYLDLRLDLFAVSLELLHIGWLGGPLNAQAFRLIGLRNLDTLVSCNSVRRRPGPLTIWK
jgi:hypothetical protein